MDKPKPRAERKPKPKLVMVTAAGSATFTPDQLARMEEAAELTCVRRVTPMSREDLGRVLAGAHVAGLTPRVRTELDAATIAAFPDSLRGLAVFATGVDYIDLEALAARGIALAHLPDYSAPAVAEHALGLMLTLSRRIHLSRDRVMGRVPKGTSVRGWELGGKTLGIVGMGRIGSRVAKLAQAFGMRLLATDPRRRAIPGVSVRWVKLATLLRESDVVSLHMPTSWGAPPLIGAAELRAMRRGAYLVNTSRMRLVDEAAVVASISAGHLAGYAVDDVIQDRRAAARLLREGRIIETGHTAWYSQESLDRGIEEWVKNAIGLAVGSPRNIVPFGPEAPAADELGQDAG